MIEAWAERIAISIKRHNEKETASVAVMTFALIILFNIVIPVAISLAIGATTGTFAETLLATFSYVLLRMISGGYHFRSAYVCMLSTVVVTTIPPHISLTDKLSLVLTCISLVIVIVLAPSNMRGYNTMSERFYPLLKIASAILVACNFLVNSHIVALVFAIQAISLFRWKEV